MAQFLVDLRSDGIGDAVASLPAVLGILKQNPGVKIDLRLSHPSLSFLFDLPRTHVNPSRISVALRKRILKSYKAIYSFSLVDFTSPQYLGKEIADSFGVDFDIENAREVAVRSMRGYETIELPDLRDVNICVVHTESLRDGWEGRAVDQNAFLSSISFLKEEGFYLVLVGAKACVSQILSASCDLDLSGKTSVRDLFHLLSRAHFFLGIDSGPLHIAQLLGVKSFALFGATLPQSKLIEGNGGFCRKDLSCVGCYHEKPNLKGWNVCERGDQTCVRDIDPQEVVEELRHYLRNRVSPKEDILFRRVQLILESRI